MFDTRPSNTTRRENAVFVTTWILDAVGRHQNRTGKRCEFLVLILPRTAVVAYEMRILCQIGIGWGLEVVNVINQALNGDCCKLSIDNFFNAENAFAEYASFSIRTEFFSEGAIGKLRFDIE
jgi:hypothetical protein